MRGFEISEYRRRARRHGGRYQGPLRRLPTQTMPSESQCPQTMRKDPQIRMRKRTRWRAGGNAIEDDEGDGGGVQNEAEAGAAAG